MTTQAAHEVRIHIDRNPYESPNPTTGEALYVLADIGKHRELFREEAGDEEDQFIPRDDAKVHLTQDAHFYSEKETTIVVNTEKKETTATRLSHQEVVLLAFPNAQPNETKLFTVEYSKGPRQNPNGTLVDGETVRIKNRMVFDVTPTNRS